MHQTNSQSGRKPTDYLFNLTVATVLGQVGCLVFVIIFVSMIAGLLLDRLFDTRPLFTILLAVGSAPAMFIAVLWVVKRATPRINPLPKESSKSNQEV